jgi:hypothetical protein
MRLGTLNAILDNQSVKIASRVKYYFKFWKTPFMVESNQYTRLSQMLVGYITDATNSYDTTYDGS